MATRNRNAEDDNDPMELLLDTVSNVFGGVMFLTLLASLLVIARSVESVAPKLDPPPPETTTQLAKAVEMETRNLERSLSTLRDVSMRLDGDGATAEKLEQRRNQVQDELKLQANLTRKSKLQAKAEAELKDQEAEISQSKEQQADLEKKLSDKEKEMQELRKAASRKVFFRPLRRDVRPEAVLVLRYGRMYLLKNRPLDAGFNASDFFVIESSRTSATITPKPHRGIEINQQSAEKMVRRLAGNFPARRFKVSLAVWGDTFEEFNKVRDELIQSGYTYRTLPMKPDGILRFGMVENPLAQ